MGNVVLNWPKIKVIKQLTAGQMLRENFDYLKDADRNLGSIGEIPGFEKLVSGWESGLAKLKTYQVIIMLGVGMTTHSVQNHIDCLKDFGVTATTFDWPAFVGDMASFKVQSDWLAKQIDKSVVLVGHSLGHLVGLQLAHDYPSKVAAFLGSGGPTRSHKDIFPAKLVELLQKMTEVSGEEIFKLLLKFKITAADIPANTRGGLGTLARVYLAHIVPPTSDYWENLYKELPTELPVHFYYGLKDRIVLHGVGMGAVFEAHNAEIVFNPYADHKMYSPGNTLKVLGHLLAKNTQS